jgi:hypothetical protein
MSEGGVMQEWLGNLCRKKVPGVILIDGNGEKIPGLDLAYEIGVAMEETGVVRCLSVWSWQAFLWLHGRFLMGDSAVDAHSWTITRRVGMMPPAFMPLAGTLVEDRVAVSDRNLLSKCIYAPHHADAELLKSAGDITLIDSRDSISLPAVERLNMAAKETGKTLIVTSELVDVQGIPHDTASYGELAMRISVEQGIDLTECAECIVSLRRDNVRGFESDRTFHCRPLKIWDDDTCSDEFVIERDVDGRFNMVACNTTR